MTVPTIEDFDNATLDLQTVAEVSNVNYLSDTTANRSGDTLDTLQGRLKKLGYVPAIAYAGGISFGTNDNAKTIERDGLIYAPLASQLPFTTTGTWATDQANFLFIAQNESSVSEVGFQYNHLATAGQNYFAAAFDVDGTTGAISNVDKRTEYNITPSTFGPYQISGFPSDNGIIATVDCGALPYSIADFDVRMTPLEDNKVIELQITGFSNVSPTERTASATLRMYTKSGVADKFNFRVEFYLRAI